MKVFPLPTPFCCILFSKALQLCFLISNCLHVDVSLFEEGGDWERKNRLKVYEGLFCMSTRNFKKAADLFLDSISTFTTYELFPYDIFIFYTVLTSIISLDRVSLKQKVLQFFPQYGSDFACFCLITIIRIISGWWHAYVNVSNFSYYVAGSRCSRDLDSDWKNPLPVRVFELSV